MLVSKDEKEIFKSQGITLQTISGPFIRAYFEDDAAISKFASSLSSHYAYSSCRSILENSEYVLISNGNIKNFCTMFGWILGHKVDEGVFV